MSAVNPPSSDQPIKGEEPKEKKKKPSKITDVAKKKIKPHEAEDISKSRRITRQASVPDLKRTRTEGASKTTGTELKAKKPSEKPSRH